MTKPKDEEKVLEVFAPTRREGEEPPVECPENRQPETDDIVDETIDESFPASDPPAIPGGTPGSPKSKKPS